MKFLFFCLLLFNFCIAQTKPVAEKIIIFSGYEWKVRNSEALQGPGPNYFNEEAAWVDDKGFLHLYLHKDSSGTKWLCPEITSVENFGYGKYSFAVEGAIDKLDKNIVLGLFNYSGKDGLDEMDIEFARWGNSALPNLNYTVWPAQKSTVRNNTYAKEYVQQSSYSMQQFVRYEDSVVFLTFNGNEVDSKNVVANYSCVPPASVSKLEMPVHINLWLFEGKPPADNKPVEIIIHSFSYK